MFNYCTSDTIIPSLTFTKAELVYALAVLTADIPPNDNETKLELVELRFYLNKIKDQIAQAVSDGTLEKFLAPPCGTKDVSQSTKNDSPLPSLDELRHQFPNLSDEEIQEILEKVTKEKMADLVKNKESPNSRPPSFIKSNPPITSSKVGIHQVYGEDKKKIANSRRFASLLGQS